MQIVLQKSDPDIVYHLAAESHVDRSIENSNAFIQSNIIGTYNLLKCCLEHFQNLNSFRKKHFVFHHVSTDESLWFFRRKRSLFRSDKGMIQEVHIQHQKLLVIISLKLGFIPINCQLLLLTVQTIFGAWQYQKVNTISNIKSFKK